jgi:hypothetical protein
VKVAPTEKTSVRGALELYAVETKEIVATAMHRVVEELSSSSQYRQTVSFRRPPKARQREVCVAQRHAERLRVGGKRGGRKWT